MKQSLLCVMLYGSVICCQQNIATSESKATNYSNSPVAQLSKLFSALVGRQLSSDDTNIYDKDQPDKGLLEKKYEDQVNSILNSEQFSNAGFYHFHKQRLLLFPDFLRVSAISREDELALQLELRDLAKNSKNYWDILSYRNRWMPIGDNRLHLDACSSYLQGRSDNDEKIACINYLKSILHPSVADPNNCRQVSVEGRYEYRKFSEEYKGRCCEISIAERHRNFCTTVDSRYNELFGKDFCAIAGIIKDDSDLTCTISDTPRPREEQESIEEIKESPSASAWANNPQKITTALNTYLSLFLGQRIDEWFSADIGSKPKVERSLLRVLDVPGEVQGIHASPLWLWTHQTSVQNQQLHRARVIYHSWFCEEISPDQATKSGQGITDKGDFVEFFAKEDKHTNDNNCFSCHKYVQPLANYFGKLAGIDSNEFDLFRYGMLARFFAQPEEAFDRPGGYLITEENFFGGDGNSKGMAGLAELLSTLPRVKSCLVKSAWNSMLGSDLPQLFPKEIAAAVQAFEAENDFRAMLKHLLLTEKAKTYFTVGSAGLAEYTRQDRCAEIRSEARNQKIFIGNVLRAHCLTCHNSTTVKSNLQIFQDNSVFAESGDVQDARLSREFIFANDCIGGSCLLRAYARLAEGSMPQGGFGENGDLKKELVTCYLAEEIKKAGLDIPVKAKANKLHMIGEMP